MSPVAMFCCTLRSKHEAISAPQRCHPLWRTCTIILSSTNIDSQVCAELSELKKPKQNPEKFLKKIIPD